MTVLVTGASGFIGRRLVRACSERDEPVIAMSRSHPVTNLTGSRSCVFVQADIGDPYSLHGLASGVHLVVHLAGYAHAEDANDASAQATHERVTVEGTRNLLAEAQRAGVRRFVFASSVKAAGEGGEVCVDETSPSRPETAYGRVKRVAEELILEAGARTGMHVSILRLPLVYGPGNKGYLPRMIAAIARGRFPPLPETHNRRSMVHVDDAVQALLLAAERPEANSKIYYVTDGRDYSTRALYDLVRAALGLRPARYHVPLALLRAGAWIGDLVGKITHRRVPLDSHVLKKLLGSACYDSRRIQAELGFRPTHTLADALPEMAASALRL